MQADLLQLLVEIEQSPDSNTWFPKIITLTRTIGLEGILAGIIDSSSTDLSKAKIVTNYNSNWREIYEKNNYADIDPVVDHAKWNVTPVVWGDELYKTVEQKYFLENATSFNLSSGITFPLHGPTGEFGTLSFQVGAPRKESLEIIRHNIPLLSMLKDTAFQKLLVLLNPPLNENPVSLSIREKEILRWSAVGKTTWEISIICNCSEANIEYHMKNIRAKFGVGTRRAACIKAIALGLIAI